MLKPEAELVNNFIESVKLSKTAEDWTFYHETAGWDLLLVHRNGTQIGVEAKTSLNTKVLQQCVSLRFNDEGPDFRVVLVPRKRYTNGLPEVAEALGLGVVMHDKSSRVCNLDHYIKFEWCPWFPILRHELPEYVPDVQGGSSSPVKLSLWKIKAIKLVVLLEKKGWVDRKDMKALGISPTVWTNPRGFLAHDRENRRYIKSPRLPDFRAQHPVNFKQIEDDYEKWAKLL